MGLSHEHVGSKIPEKNQYLYAHQSRVTYHSLLWDTLYYTWKCVNCVKVVDFEYHRQLSVFSAANSKLHSNYWYLGVKWNCILIYSKMIYKLGVFTIENM